MGSRFKNIISVLCLFFVVSACTRREVSTGYRPNWGSDGSTSFGDEGSNTNTQTQSSSGGVTIPTTTYAALGCNVVSSSDTVNPGEIVTLTVTGTGGLAPYSIPNYVTSFNPVTSLTGSFDNFSSNSIVINRSVPIVDARGVSSSCQFSLTVRPYGSTGGGSSSGGLNCTITPSTNSPQPSQAVTFNVVAQGGTSAYQFGSFSPQSGVSIATSSTGANSVSATYAYATSGTYTATISISNNGQSASCSSTINVRSPQLQVVASPSSTVDVGTPITLQTIVTGFDPSRVPLYTYTTTETGIKILPNGDGSSATVTAQDNQFHDFNVTVKVETTDGLSQTQNIHLTFNAALTCTMVVTGSATVGSPMQLAVQASTGESLYLTSVTGVDLLTGMSGSTATFQYQSSGSKTIQAYARSNTRNVSCNQGAAITQVVTIKSALTSCSVSTSPNPSIAGTPVRMSGTIPANSGVGPFRFLYTSGGNPVHVDPSVGDYQTVRYYDSGTWNVSLQVTDLSDGTTVSCSTYHTVTPQSGLEARVFPIPANNSYVIGDTFDGLTSTQKFYATNIDVSPRSWTSGFPGVVGYTEWYAISFRGRIEVPVSGLYNFKIVSDDGVQMWIDGILTVSDPNIHAPRNSYGSFWLTAGTHTLKLNYFQGPRVEIALQLFWQGPGQSGYSIIPASAFTRPTTSLP